MSRSPSNVARNPGRGAKAFGLGDRDRLISFVIRRRRRLLQKVGLRPSDVMPQCLVAADHAIRSFDPTKGAISNWIFIHVSRAIFDWAADQSGLSHNVFAKFLRFRASRYRSEEDGGVVPDEDEIMCRANLSPGNMRSVRIADGLMTACDVEDAIHHRDDSDIDEIVWDSWLAVTVRRIIDEMRDAGRLTQRHVDVLERRFIMGMNLRSTGVSLGISGEAVRQSEIKALRILRGHPTISSIRSEHFTPSEPSESDGRTSRAGG